MKSIKKLLCISSLSLLPFGALASTYDFGGELVLYDALGMASSPSPSFGNLDFDFTTGQGNGGTIFEGGPKVGSSFSNIQISGIGNDLFNIDYTVNIFGTSFASTSVWEILELSGGDLSITTVDGDGDGIPGIAFTSEMPFPGFSMAINGTLTAVPLPASIWLFGAGILGFMRISRNQQAIT